MFFFFFSKINFLLPLPNFTFYNWCKSFLHLVEFYSEISLFFFHKEYLDVLTSYLHRSHFSKYFVKNRKFELNHLFNYILMSNNFFNFLHRKKRSFENFKKNKSQCKFKISKKKTQSQKI